jgi:hypothetical protein
MEISTEIRCSEGCGHCQFAMDGRQPPSLFFFPLSLKVLPTASSIRSRTHESSALPHTLLCGTHKPKRSMAMLLLHLTRPLPVRCARFVRPCMHAHRSFFFFCLILPIVYQLVLLLLPPPRSINIICLTASGSARIEYSICLLFLLLLLGPVLLEQ